MTLYRMSLFLFFGIVQIFISLINADTGKNLTLMIEVPGKNESSQKLRYIGVERFDSLQSKLHQSYESDFGLGPNSQITGTYSGLTVAGIYNDTLGCASHTEKRAVARKGSSYSLHLSQNGKSGLKNFGFYWESISVENTLIVNYQQQEVVRLTGHDILKILKNGDPNYFGQLSLKADAFITLAFEGVFFDELIFQQSDDGEFLSDNHTVGYSDDSPDMSSTTTTTTPCTDESCFSNPKFDVISYC